MEKYDRSGGLVRSEGQPKSDDGSRLLHDDGEATGQNVPANESEFALIRSQPTGNGSCDEPSQQQLSRVEVPRGKSVGGKET